MNGIQKAIERLNVSMPAIVLAMEKNENLRLLVSIWPTLALKSDAKAVLDDTPDGFELPELRIWMWLVYKLDTPKTLSQIRDVLGPAFPALSTLKQAQSIGAVYPYGIVNKSADALIKAHATAIVKDLHGQAGGGT